MLRSSKLCIHLTPLTLPPLYFGFSPWNPWKLIENEMNVLCNVLNICFLHYNLCNFNLFNNQWFYIVLTSLSTNLVYGFISKGCIFDTFFSIVGIILTCFCSWVICRSFSSWPPPLRSCGFFIYISSSFNYLSFEVMWLFSLHFLLLRCSLGLLQPPHPCLMPLYLLDCHKQNLENSFAKLPTCTS
jgi:hypothetical protein